MVHPPPARGDLATRGMSTRERLGRPSPESAHGSSASNRDGCGCVGVDSARDRLVVRGAQQGGNRHFEVDLAVHGAGAVPEIDDLDPPPAGVKRERRGVVVNNFFRASNPAVLRGGDPRERAAADVEGHPRRRSVDHESPRGQPPHAQVRRIASACFTLPPIASAGLTEEAARTVAAVSHELAGHLGMVQHARSGKRFPPSRC